MFRMADEKVVTWVLGAGFSRSLGAPLLQTLFGSDRLHDLQARYPATTCQTLTGDYIDAISPLYQVGLGQGLWPDPEAFLDYLDLAASPRDQLTGKGSSASASIAARQTNPEREQRSRR
jgi:hypothetical protein